MNNKGINRNLNEICSILNKLERMGCEYSFQFMSTSGLVISRSYLSKEGIIDTFECNDLINKIRDLVDEIPVEKINNLLLQFHHNKIQKIIGFGQINNKKPINTSEKIQEEVIGNLNSMKPLTPEMMSRVSNNPINIGNMPSNYNENIIEDETISEISEDDIEDLSFEQQQVLNDMNQKISDIVDEITNNNRIDMNVSPEQILKMIDPNRIENIISEFFNKFKENDIPLIIMSKTLKKYGILINFR